MNKIISCDTSVLINFFRVKRVDLLGGCSYSFFVTDHVQDEISSSFPEQRSQLEAGLDQNVLRRINVETAREFELFAELSKSGQLGAGECAAIAIACCRQYFLAVDDNLAIKKALTYLPHDTILRTQDLVLIMIREGILKTEEADQMLQEWSNEHRFKLKISSFSELAMSK